ncbi:MAG: oxidoreductase [Planctomycetes bacterium GWF2_42_9]|nr:MAG: oxidoreductase [Planctomycetes bacterium GWF2_42_9]
MSKVRLAIAGGGGRGFVYASYAKKHPDLAEVVAVAEPLEYRRNKMAKEFSIPSQNVFCDWKELASMPKLADAVIIATQDSMHVEPCLAFANKGYAILLEKPMATKEEDCKMIADVVKANNIMFAVCHVMRYTDYTQKVKSIIKSGVLGDVVSVQHLEQVGFAHQAHSFVRGSWRNQNECVFMLMAKSCHDIDWLQYIVASPIKKVSSFGNLKHFRKENKPVGAANRCLDCLCEKNCPYSAVKIYLKPAQEGNYDWQVRAIINEHTVENVMTALRNGPFGRCVYACDNDVVDHQVVAMEFDNGSTANFTMTAFCEQTDRVTRIFGTRGQLIGDGNKILHYDFLTRKTECIEIGFSDGGIDTGHGGGDYAIMREFIKAVSTKDTSSILSGIDESLNSHIAVFAAEKSRLNQNVEKVI